MGPRQASGYPCALPGESTNVSCLSVDYLPVNRHVDQPLHPVCCLVNADQMCFGLADKFAGGSTVSGPGALDIGGALPPTGVDVDVAAIEQSVAEEGCVGETLSAVEAGVAAALATDDPVVAAVLRTIADDEARHAALAWRFVQWRVSAGSDPDALKSAIDVELRQHEARLLASADHAHARHLDARGPPACCATRQGVCCASRARRGIRRGRVRGRWRGGALGGRTHFRVCKSAWRARAGRVAGRRPFS